MALFPRKFDVYHIPGIPRAPEYNAQDQRVFRGHGSDGTQYTDNIIYFMSIPLERTVTFKAFFESLKINLTKEIDSKNDADKNSILVREYAGQITYDLAINIPAHSVNESVNNLAKIEELQKLISPTDKTKNKSGRFINLEPNAATGNPTFRVMMKNLISSGAPGYQGVNYNINPDYETLTAMGIPCFIEEVNYEPDVSAGFFEFKNYFYPKNIKLSLKLNLDQTIDQNRGFEKVILPFTNDGAFDLEDLGSFPFGIGVSYDGKESEENSANFNFDYTNKTINMLDFKNERRDGYVFISNGIENKTDLNTPRWVIFKPFVENFSRSNSTTFKKLESKSIHINNAIDPGSNPTFKSLRFSFKLNLPAKDVEEAKRNCGKLSYLTRMFFVKQNDTSNNKSKLSVYIPGMLEKAGASRSFPANNYYDGMLSNAVSLYIENLNLDIDMSAGFFEEKGRLYPKVMSIDFIFFDDTGDLIKNYKQGISLDGRSYSHLQSSTYAGSEHLFPFNRQTSKLKIGE